MELTTLSVFVLLILAGISADLYAHKDSKDISFKDATLWSIVWVLISVIFGGYLAVYESTDKAHLFFTGYLLEKALSVDNLFVFMAIFAWFNIPNSSAHRILYWGIFGAIFFRLIFVLLGTTIMEFSHWIEVLFGVIVIWSGYKLLTSSKEDEEDISKSIAYRIANKFVPITTKIQGNKFFVVDKVTGIKYATPLLLCLIVTEISDILFAFDSVPAVLAVTKELSIVWYAMIFAICGLRTMYFMLSSLKEIFIYLEKGVIFLLFFIGFKLILNSLDEVYQIGYNIHNNVSLLVVALTITGSILLSLIKNKKEI